MMILFNVCKLYISGEIAGGLEVTGGISGQSS